MLRKFGRNMAVEFGFSGLIFIVFVVAYFSTHGTVNKVVCWSAVALLLADLFIGSAWRKAYRDTQAEKQDQNRVHP